MTGMTVPWPSSGRVDEWGLVGRADAHQEAALSPCTTNALMPSAETRSPRIGKGARGCSRCARTNWVGGSGGVGCKRDVWRTRALELAASPAYCAVHSCMYASHSGRYRKSATRPVAVAGRRQTSRPPRPCATHRRALIGVAAAHARRHNGAHAWRALQQPGSEHGTFCQARMPSRPSSHCRCIRAAASGGMPRRRRSEKNRSTAVARKR